MGAYMIGDNSERDRKASEHRHVCRVSMNSSRSALRYLQNPSSYVTHWVTVLVYCKHHGTDRFGDGRVIYMAGLGKLALSSSNSHGHNVLVTSAYSRKASCLSVRFHPPVSARFQPDGFPWNSILLTFMTICHEICNLVPIGRKYRVLHLKT